MISRFSCRLSVNSRVFCRNASSLNLSGVFPPIFTPYDSNEDILINKLLHNLRILKTKKFKGYTIFGSIGEFPYLSLEERVMLLDTVKTEDPDKIIIAGAGQESTKMTERTVIELAKAGADTALIYSPCFYKRLMNDNAILSHFLRLADMSPIPITLYSVPAIYSGVDVPLPVVVKLAEHENVIGIKESSSDIVRIGDIASKTKHLDFQILAGAASFMLASYSVGATGTIATLANVMGDEVIELHNKIMNNEDCVELQHKLIAPNTAVTAGFGLPGLKFVCDNIGLYGGPCRSPILPLNEQQKRDLALIMAEVGIECTV